MAARRSPRTPLLYTPERKPLTFGLSLGQIERSRALSEHSIAPESLVAVVLPNGPELATSFVEISSTPFA